MPRENNGVGGGKRVREDLAHIKASDPAARSAFETALTYPGLHAIWGYRVSSWLWHHQGRFAARLVAGWARFMTGVDIHPAASIGDRIFIDHAVGVVIGETAVVGNDVTIYQGVTLGGTTLQHGKRHPTIGDRVTIGSGAKVLGAITVGSDARIGANSVVLRDVPDGAVVVGVPGQVISSDGPVAAAIEGRLEPPLTDPVAASLASILKRLEELEGRETEDTSGRLVGPRADGTWSAAQFEDFSI